MPRSSQRIDDIIRSVVAQAMQQVAPAIQRHVATLAAQELEKCLALKEWATGVRLGRADLVDIVGRAEERLFLVT